MVRAWTLRTQSGGTLLGAAALAPAIAVLGALSARAVLELPAHGALAHGSAREIAGLGLVFLALEASFSWMGLGRLLLNRDGGLFLQRTLLASVGAMVAATLAFALLPAISPGPGEVLALGAASAALLVAVRTLLPRLVESSAIFDGVLILGRGDLAAKICLDLLQGQQVERFAGVLDVGSRVQDTRSGRQASAIVPARLQQLVRKERISRIVVAEPDAAARREITSALLECRLMGVQVEDAVEFYEQRHGKLWLEALDPGRLVFSRGFRITPAYRRAKRVLDLACAALLLLVAAPVMALIALVIKLTSPGPVLFRQQRVGQFGRPFTLYKFRSMGVDAEAGGPVWARENDQRATPFGRLLRRTHLDELPQVINVLKNELSFVGPRPERQCFVDLLRERIEYYDLRHYVQPGITGWAQVCYPYAGSIEDSREKLQYDLSYAQNASIAFDLKVLVRTVFDMLGGRGR